MSTTTPKRCRLRLSLRVAMLLVLVTGTWMGSVVNTARRQRDAVAEIKRWGGGVRYDWEFVNGKPKKGTQPPGPQWLRQFLGDEFFQDVVQVTLDDDSPPVPTGRVSRELAYVGSMPRLKTLIVRKAIPVGDDELGQFGRMTTLEELYVMGGFSVTDEGVAHLRSLNRLKTLQISPVGPGKLTDASLRHVANLSRLEILSLQGNLFTDAGLIELGRMTNLRKLYLGRGASRFSDAIFIHLAGRLRNLEFLDLQGTTVTDEGLGALKGSPKLKEIWTSGGVTREHRKKLQGMLPQVRRIQ